MEKKQPILSKTVVEIEYLLREISVILKRKSRKILADFPITSPQFSALICLNEYGDMTIGELSQKMNIACSTMTDLIDRMEIKNLVTRVRNDRDRRVVRIHLLDYGRNLIQEVLKLRQNYLQEILDNYTDEETFRIEQTLRVVHNQMIGMD